MESANIPPTLQIQTDIDYNEWGDEFEFITYNYKGDVQYYNTEALRELTSGILPVVVYPSIAPYDTDNQWTNCSLCLTGNGSVPPDIDPNKPYNGNNTPQGWFSLSEAVNKGLAHYDYQGHGKGSVLPQSQYIQDSIESHPHKTVSLFCALYHSQEPEDYLVKIPVGDQSELNFYVLNIQNGN